MGKSLVLLVAMAAVAGGTALADQSAKNKGGVRIPDAGVEHIFHCEDSSGRTLEDSRIFTVMEDGRLHIDVSTRSQSKTEKIWMEKQAADLGIWVYDLYNYGDGAWRSNHEIESLEKVRQLIPGARAEGYVEYSDASKDTVWDRFAISVEILPPSVIAHEVLGDIEVIRIESRRWKWKGKNRRWNWGEKKWVGEFEPNSLASQVAYVSVTTGMIVRYHRVSSSGLETVCDRLGPN